MTASTDQRLPSTFVLTVTSAEGDEQSLHDTPEAAHTALYDYLVRKDCYHSPTQLGADHSAYEVLNLQQGRPRVIGVATIEKHAAPARLTDRIARRSRRTLAAAPAPSPQAAIR